MPKPLCHVVEIIHLLSSYEAHVVMFMVWKHLKVEMRAAKQNSGQASGPAQVKPSFDPKKLRHIFQKNITILGPFYAKFFKASK